MKKLLYLILLYPLLLNSQQANNWTFGNNVGISFNSGTPVNFTGSQLSQTEGSATISDESGNLLFYTSGLTIWNRNHAVMTNGAGLKGDQSSTQSAIIVQQPGSNSVYYVFTADADVGADGINYNVVDMSLSGGYGAVTVKNIPLHTPSCEKLTAVRHCNNVDVWIVTHDWNSNGFRSWLLTSSGLNPAPVMSYAGYAPSGAVQASFGQMKSNQQGNMLACAYYGSGNGQLVQLYPFDNSLGQVTSFINLGAVTAVYGIEFSRSGRVLYASTNTAEFYQWNLCAANISASKYLISNEPLQAGSLQFAPDGKIYCSRSGLSQLSVINNPEVMGAGCGFVADGFITLNPTRFGLPNFCPFYLNATSFNVSKSGCRSYCFSVPIVNECLSVAPNYRWIIDGNVYFSNMMCRTFDAGSHSVTLETTTNCITDSVSISIDVSEINGALNLW